MKVVLKKALKNAVTGCGHDGKLDSGDTKDHITVTPAMSSSTGWFPFSGQSLSLNDF
jgi:hypothetical protein